MGDPAVGEPQRGFGLCAGCAVLVGMPAASVESAGIIASVGVAATAECLTASSTDTGTASMVSSTVAVGGMAAPVGVSLDAGLPVHVSTGDTAAEFTSASAGASDGWRCRRWCGGCGGCSVASVASVASVVIVIIVIIVIVVRGR